MGSEGTEQSDIFQGASGSWQIGEPHSSKAWGIGLLLVSLGLRSLSHYLEAP